MNWMRRFSVAAFLMAQTILYLLFLSRDLAGAGNETALLKYGSIVLCLLASGYWSVKGGDKLVTAALALTLGADTFLLLLNRDYPLGVLLFCGVQGLYLVRIYRKNGRNSLWAVRLGCCLLAYLALWKTERMNPLNALVVFYIINFVWNAVQSLALSGLGARLFSAGLVLFLCCDLCVGVFNQPDLFPNFWYLFATIAMWLFYLPAQVLIVLSGLPDLDAVRECP
ncbi:MAG: lysoplasmalogenase family protein [Lawsonibacter sp.]